jgi:hypothetical protein
MRRILYTLAENAVKPERQVVVRAPSWLHNPATVGEDPMDVTLAFMRATLHGPDGQSRPWRVNTNEKES